MDHATKFQKLVQFRAPESLSDAIDAAASKHLQSKSEYIRRSVFESLKADGVDLSQRRLPRDQDGKVDFQIAYERLVTVGGAPAIDQAGSMATSGLTQDRIRFAPQAASILRGDDQAPPAAAPGGFPPSTSRNESAVVAPPTGTGRGGASPPPQAGAPAPGTPQSDRGFFTDWRGSPMRGR